MTEWQYDDRGMGVKVPIPEWSTEKLRRVATDFGPAFGGSVIGEATAALTWAADRIEHLEADLVTANERGDGFRGDHRADEPECSLLCAGTEMEIAP